MSHLSTADRADIDPGPAGDDLDGLDEAGVHRVAIDERGARWAAGGTYPLAVATVLRVAARARVHPATRLWAVARTPELRARIRADRAHRAKAGAR